MIATRLLDAAAYRRV